MGEGLVQFHRFPEGCGETRSWGGVTEPIEAAIDESSETIAAEVLLEEALAAVALAAAKSAK